jgi:hypothetical protein
MGNRPVAFLALKRAKVELEPLQKSFKCQVVWCHRLMLVILFAAALACGVYGNDGVTGALGASIGANEENALFIVRRFVVRVEIDYKLRERAWFHESPAATALFFPDHLRAAILAFHKPAKLR